MNGCQIPVGLIRQSNQANHISSMHSICVLTTLSYRVPIAKWPSFIEQRWFKGHPCPVRFGGTRLSRPLHSVW